MSGLFSAAFLRQIGWDVDVYERSSVELDLPGRRRSPSASAVPMAVSAIRTCRGRCPARRPCGMDGAAVEAEQAPGEIAEVTLAERGRETMCQPEIPFAFRLRHRSSSAPLRDTFEP